MTSPIKTKKSVLIERSSSVRAGSNENDVPLIYLVVPRRTPFDRFMPFGQTLIAASTRPKLLIAAKSVVDGALNTGT